MTQGEPLPYDCGRVILRRLAPADLTAFQDYRRDPETGRYQGWAAMSDDEAWAFLAEMAVAPPFPAGEWWQIGIAERTSDGLIGDIGICVSADRRAAEIGFTLGRHSQGRGLGSEAVRGAIGLLFAHTPVDRIFAITDARNLASVRLLERIGMGKSQTLNSLFRGEPCVEYRYVLARRDGR
jgi:RimJ/RimL family protein N-acetyltransferase